MLLCAGPITRTASLWSWSLNLVFPEPSYWRGFSSHCRGAVRRPLSCFSWRRWLLAACLPFHSTCRRRSLLRRWLLGAYALVAVTWSLAWTWEQVELARAFHAPPSVVGLSDLFQLAAQWPLDYELQRAPVERVLLLIRNQPVPLFLACAVVQSALAADPHSPDLIKLREFMHSCTNLGG